MRQNLRLVIEFSDRARRLPIQRHLPPGSREKGVGGRDPNAFPTKLKISSPPSFSYSFSSFSSFFFFLIPWLMQRQHR